MYVHVIFLLVINEIFGVHSCPIYLTASIHPSISQGSLVIVNYGPCDDSPPHKIRIYDDNPYLSSIQPLEEVIPNPNAHDGKFETSLKMGDLKFPPQWTKNSEPNEYKYESNCINFYILSFNPSNEVETFNCLKINPQWMTKSKELWLFPLKQLLIPGSQCSGCYITSRNRRRRNVKSLDFRQNISVWQQLVLGIRYLEFSVGYFRSFHEFLDVKGRFWIFSGNHEISPIFPILEEIKNFVELSKEIVILDFRNFTYGFHNASGAHEIFKRLLYSTLADVAMIREKENSKAFDLTIQKMKNASKYLLILYDYKDTDEKILSQEYESIFWPTLRRNELKPNENVSNFLENKQSSNFTVDSDDGFIFGVDYESSFENIDKLNFKIASSLTESWNEKVNVISLDYILSTNLIDISLHINHQKALSKQNFIVIDL